MSSRYLVATGNWNDTAVWSATSGGASGASVPTASDDVFLGSAPTNATVTLTADAVCNNISSTMPRQVNPLVLNGHKLTLSGNLSASFMQLDLTNSTLEVNGTITIAASGVITFTNSLVILNVSTNSTFQTNSRTFNDCIIKLSGTSETLSITDSPSFRLLDIRSANSAAHTVDIPVLDSTSNAAITVDKFIAVGSSSSNKISFNSSSAISPSNNFNSIKINNSCYGENLNFSGVPTYGTYLIGSAPRYLGVNTTYTNYTGVLQQNPPKINTLIDPLTTSPGSNTNWTVTGTVSQITTGLGGGGYRFSSGGSIISTDTFDLTSSSIMIQTDFSFSGPFHIDLSISTPRGRIAVDFNYGVVSVNPTNWTNFNIADTVKFSINGSNELIYSRSSDNGSTWTDVTMGTFTSEELPLFKSSRIKYVASGDVVADFLSVNITPTPPATSSGMLVQQNGRFIKANGKLLKI